jgi:hypothetical protein
VYVGNEISWSAIIGTVYPKVNWPSLSWKNTYEMEWFSVLNHRWSWFSSSNTVPPYWAPRNLLNYTHNAVKTFTVV